MKIILGILVLLALIVPASTLAANGGGSIEGTIVNGTSDGKSTADISVTLRLYQGEAELDSLNTPADSNGAFLFTDLDTSASIDYQVYVEFEGVGYSSGLFNFEGEIRTLTVDLPVYDVTMDTDVISTVLSHVVASRSGNIVGIREIYVLVNMSDRTLVSSSGTDSVIFPLPAGARNISYSNGIDSHIILTNSGFKFSSPLLPGEYQESFTYEMDIQDGQIDISRRYSNAVMQLDFLISDNSLDVSSNVLTKSEPLNIGGTLYDHYQATTLPAGTALELSISEAGGGGGIKSYLWLLIVVGVVIILFLVWYHYVRRKKGKQIETSDNNEIQGLISELALLDDSFEQGKISRDDYQEQRDAKKARLVRLMGGSD